MKAYTHSLSFSGMAHHGWRSVADNGPMAKLIGGAEGVLMCIT